MPSNIGSECTISSWWTSHFLPPYGFFTIQVCLLLLHNLEPESYGFIYWDRFTGATISYSPSTILTTILIECLASGYTDTPGSHFIHSLCVVFVLHFSPTNWHDTIQLSLFKLLPYPSSVQFLTLWLIEFEVPLPPQDLK